jgi:hypothetical protein
MPRFEQDRTWLMLGMAIRMATDLNLHRKSMVSGLDTEEGRARDLEVGYCEPRVADVLIDRSSTENEHGYYASFSTDPSLRKWVNHILCGKTISSETPVKLLGIYNASPYLRIGHWQHTLSCNRSCPGLSTPSTPRHKLYLACVMTVTVSNSRHLRIQLLTSRYVDCEISTRGITSVASRGKQSLPRKRAAADLLVV